MTFAQPWILILLPICWLLLRRQRQRSSVQVASLQLWPGQSVGKARFLWIPVALRRICLALLIFALARPQAGTTYDMDVSEGIAIQLLVDVSSSMDMSVKNFDGKTTSRMEIAKEMVERFIAGDGEHLTGRPNDLIGLITFARYADTRSPLTFGHDALLQIVRQLSIQERPNEDGTAYGDALALAAARLENPQELKQGKATDTDVENIASKVIILLTDGENNSGAHLPTEAAGLAKAWNTRIYAISLGEALDSKQAVETLSAAEKVLEHISLETGGIFRQAHDFESLLSVYTEIDQLERAEISKRSFDRVAEYFWVPLAAALACLSLALILEATWLRVVP